MKIGAKSRRDVYSNRLAFIHNSRAPKGVGMWTDLRSQILNN